MPYGQKPTFTSAGGATIAYNPAYGSLEQHKARVDRFERLGIGSSPWETMQNRGKPVKDRVAEQREWSRKMQDLMKYAAFEPTGQAYQDLMGRPRSQLGAQYASKNPNYMGGKPTNVAGRIGGFENVPGYVSYDPQNPKSWESSWGSIQPKIQQQLAYEKENPVWTTDPSKYKSLLVQSLGGHAKNVDPNWLASLPSYALKGIRNPLGSLPVAKTMRQNLGSYGNSRQI